MATAIRNSDRDYSIASDAIEMMDCLTNGLDEVVLDIAVSIAAKRHAGKNAPLRIEADDINEAMAFLVAAIREKAEKTPDLEEFLRTFGDISECLGSKRNPPRSF